MHPVEVEEALKTLTVIVDTREQDTPELRKRLQSFPRFERSKVNAGDYSAKVLIKGGWVQLPVAIERKMNIDELCYCFCQQRSRFKREFERAKTAKIKLYLLIEDGTWEKIYRGFYASKMRSNSLIGSIMAYLSRYDCQFLMCSRQTTGRLIWDILRYEAREILLKMEG